MKTLVLATTNRHKIGEIRQKLNGQPFELKSLVDFPPMPPVIEDGETFEANALKKARAVFSHTGLPSMADDSGLEVDALSGRPGVFSARYAGDHHDDHDNLKKVLGEMEAVPEDRRTARFRCAIAWIDPDSHGSPTEHVFFGQCKGTLIRSPRGTNGFGYDPIFFIPEFDRTMAELPLETKNKISHRARALDEWIRFLQKK